MKKILVLGLMFVMFAPFVSMAAICATEMPDGTIIESSCPDTPPSSGEAGYTGYNSLSPIQDAGLSGGAGNVSKLVSFLGALLNIATRLILGAAVVFFLWGVFQFVKSAGDEEARKIGKDRIIYGVIGIAVMISMWGLVNFVTSSIGLNDTEYTVPKLLDMPN